MNRLRERCVEVTEEYWACRENQSERVAVAQLILQLVKREDLLGWIGDDGALKEMAFSRHDPRQDSAK